jgi:hypothetical protein
MKDGHRLGRRLVALDDHRQIGPAELARRGVGRIPVEDVEVGVVTRTHEERRPPRDAAVSRVGHPLERVRDRGRLRVRGLRRVQPLDRDDERVRRRLKVQAVVVWKTREANLVEACG